MTRPDAAVRRRAAHRRPVAAWVAVASSALLLTACSGADGAPGHSGAPSSASSARPDPTLYLDPAGSAVAALSAAEAEHSPDVDRLRRLAEQPTATWVTTADRDSAFERASSVARGAAAEGKVALLVSYSIPGRDCGRFSGGGAADGGQYADGIGALAAGIGDADALVVLEPDAVAHTFDGCVAEDAADARYEQLATAVRILKEQPHVRVYLDAGNPTWVQDLPELADRLRRSGVEQADGFALNTANFVSTDANREYGGRLSELLGGAHFVIDTSRDGASVPVGTPGGLEWCNPPQARLGQPPTTTATGDPLVDALLWVKQPGESDGACRPGEPEAGRWWEAYALQLTS